MRPVFREIKSHQRPFPLMLVVLVAIFAIVIVAVPLSCDLKRNSTMFGAGRSKPASHLVQMKTSA
jgi:hypothetical protein